MDTAMSLERHKTTVSAYLLQTFLSKVSYNMESPVKLLSRT